MVYILDIVCISPDDTRYMFSLRVFPHFGAFLFLLYDIYHSRVQRKMTVRSDHIVDVNEMVGLLRFFYISVTSFPAKTIVRSCLVV